MNRPSLTTAVLAAAIASGALAPIVVNAGTAAAAALCGMRNDVARDLETDHGEVPTAWGLVGNSHMVEVFVAPSGSFTIVITRPDGLACIMAAGGDWQALKKRGKDPAT